VSSLLGDTGVYLLGGANEAGRKCGSSYLLHWRALERMKSAGMRWYDLGGINPVDNPGGYQFKKGMGGMDLCAPGPYQIKPAGVRGMPVQIAEGAMLFKRALKEKVSRLG
jgi:lipid II:glycine glycyltransferase (peptidoglycan interpeptide bridge formation enzyme)